jgi:hypothetical protein
MTEPRSRTSLTAYAASMRDPDPEGARRLAGQAWRDSGIVVIFPGQLDKLDQMFVEAAANRLYGKRK